MLTLDRRFVLALPLLSLVACGPKAVQLYDGPKLDEGDVTYLITNPHLKVTVDRQNKVEDQALQKLELPKGHHVAEVQCVYTPDVTYHPAKGVDPNASGPLKGDFKESPPIAVVMDGEPGKIYKLRAHFERHAGDLPGCRVRMFDVTNESGGHKVHFY